MYKELTFCSFCDEFNSVRPNSFSYNGLKALYEYLEEFENIELDVIAIDCEFVECSIEEALKDYGLEDISELEQNTMVLKIDDDNIIYQNY